MALTVGELNAIMDLDDSQYNQKLDRGERRFAGAGAAIGRTAKRVATITGAAITAAGAIGLSVAAKMEQAKIAFTTMLGSGRKAQSFLNDLSAFAAKTPFEFPELQTAASSLISAGINAKKVIPIMTTLGDVTSGMGTGSEGIKRATIALQQMNAAGRITGEDLNQLRDAGIPVYDLLAAATGKSKAEIVKLAQAGKLGKKELGLMMEALESGKGLERFSGLMEKQSASLTGLWSTLKDTFSVGMATAIQPLIPLIKDGLGGAIKFLSANMPRLAAGLAVVVRHVRAWFAAKAKGVDVGSMFDRVQRAAAKMWPQIREAADEMRGIGPIVSVTGRVFGFLADHIDTLVKYLPLLIAGFLAVKAAQALGNAAAIAAIPLQAAQIASNFALAAALRSTATASTSSAAQQVAASGAIQTSTMRTQLAALRSMAVMVAKWAWMGVQSLLHAAKVALAWLIAMGPIALVVAAVIALVVVVVKNWDTIKRVIIGAATAVLGWLRANWPLILAVLTGPIGIAVLMIVRNWDKIKAGTKRMKDAVVEKFRELVAFVKSIPGKISDALGNLGTLLVEKGRDMIRGLIEGIKSMAGAIRDVLVDLLPGPLKKFAGKLGLASPSKLFRGFGRDTIAGFVLGIQDMERKVTAALVASVRPPMLAAAGQPVGAVPGGSLAAGGGMRVEHLEVKAFTDRFSLSQVQAELALHGAA